MKKILCLLTVIAMTLSFATFSAMAETTDSGAIVIAAPYVRQEEYAVGTARPTGEVNSVHYSYPHGEYEEIGSWKTLKEASLYLGYDGEGDVRRGVAENASVVMTPKANVLSPGYYDVEWWHLFRANYGDTTAISYSIVYDGGSRTATGTINTAEIDHQAWYTVGTYFFRGTGNESVTFKQASGSATPNMSVDAARFVPNKNVDSNDIFSMYATVTNNTATEKIYPTLGKGEDGQDYYYFPSLGSAGTYTVTVEGAENATISIENKNAAGTLTTDSYAVNGNAKVLEVAVTSKSGEEKKSLIIINRADAVAYNAQDNFEAMGAFGTTTVLSFDKTLTRCTDVKDAGGAWTIPENAVTPGYYKLQFYNCYADAKPENTEFIASYTIDGVTVDQKIYVDLNKVADSVKGELTWLTIGEVYLTGNGADKISVFNRDGAAGHYLRIAGIRLSNPDLMIEDYGIFDGNEKLASPAAGDNKGVLKAYNFKAQDAAAHLILAKYDETGKLLNQVVYNKNNSARLNKGNINLETSAISVGADEKCVLKLFCWKEGTIAPLLEEIALDKTE